MTVTIPSYSPMETGLPAVFQPQSGAPGQSLYVFWYVPYLVSAFSWEAPLPLTLPNLTVRHGSAIKQVAFLPHQGNLVSRVWPPADDKH